MLQVALDPCVNKQMQPSVLELRHLIATVFKDVLRQDIGTMISGLGFYIYEVLHLVVRNTSILLMAEILHHLGCMKPYK